MDEIDIYDDMGDMPVAEGGDSMYEAVVTSFLPSKEEDAGNDLDKSSTSAAGDEGTMDVDKEAQFQSAAQEAFVQNNTNPSIYVGNLTWFTTDVQLEGLMSPFGKVVKIQYFEDRVNCKLKGHVMVEFDNPQSAAKAINALNNSELNGNSITVVLADSNSAKQFNYRGSVNRGNSRDERRSNPYPRPNNNNGMGMPGMGGPYYGGGGGRGSRRRGRGGGGGDMMPRGMPDPHMYRPEGRGMYGHPPVAPHVNPAFFDARMQYMGGAGGPGTYPYPSDGPGGAGTRGGLPERGDRDRDRDRVDREKGGRDRDRGNRDRERDRGDRDRGDRDRDRDRDRREHEERSRSSRDSRRSRDRPERIERGDRDRDRGDRERDRGREKGRSGERRRDEHRRR